MPNDHDEIKAKLARLDTEESTLGIHLAAVQQNYRELTYTLASMKRQMDETRERLDGIQKTKQSLRNRLGLTVVEGGGAS